MPYVDMPVWQVPVTVRLRRTLYVPAASFSEALAALNTDEGWHNAARYDNDAVFHASARDRMIDSAPTLVDGVTDEVWVEPVPDPEGPHWECQECRAHGENELPPDFCPNCSASDELVRYSHTVRDAEAAAGPEAETEAASEARAEAGTQAVIDRLAAQGIVSTSDNPPTPGTPGTDWLRAQGVTLPPAVDPAARRGGGDPLADYLHGKGE